MNGSTDLLMRERLQALSPELIDIQDESSQHIGHEGAKGGGGHYWMTIVSAAFVGQSRIERHRLIYQALGDLMQTRIHALSIKAYAPEEM
ncbi:BolA protein [Chitinivorax tropicus]|uniref:BolA protein n=1 Tax=Chitinivorax tropicus TaxID=714531 RepID=A0A840MJH0_9PROT|nr:BolA family protein [Chitinivorax tropicus]MBB5016957.1 BolA protein [Chitinivorax tropicus]